MNSKYVAAAWVLACLSASGCGKPQQPQLPGTQTRAAAPAADAGESGKYREQRQAMVRTLSSFGKFDAKVLAALGSVPRHEFVPAEWRREAYDPHHPLPIGEGQTISAPDVVAIMTHLLDVQPTDTCLEIGTGSGYQAAVLSLLSSQVYTIEIVPSLAKSAESRLKALGYGNVHVLCGDGYKGWPQHAPFDKVIVTAAPPTVPQPLLDQLKPGGRMVLPVGEPHDCDLVLISKNVDGSLTRESVLRVAFVPMVGEAQKQKGDPAVGTQTKP